MKVTIECMSCEGTGLYHGFCEPKNTAVICCNCKGTGYDIIEYKPFVYRKMKSGIKWVLTNGNTITADDFYSKM